MIVVLSAEHKQDLAFLGDGDGFTVPMLQKFCDITMQFLHKGSEGCKAMFVAAAKSLKTQPKTVEKGITFSNGHDLQLQR